MVQTTLRRWKDKGRESGVQIPSELSLPLCLRGEVVAAKMSPFGTVPLLPCCCHLFCPAEAGAAGPVVQMAQAGLQREQSCQILTSSVPGVTPACWAACGTEGSRGLPLENVYFEATYVQFKLDTSNNGRGLMSFYRRWIYLLLMFTDYLLDLTDSIPGSCFIQER